MPRNRSNVDREQKIEEILEVAESAVRAGGYDAISVHTIAEEVGIARGAVYWYFPSKDHLYAAAAARAIKTALADPPGGADPIALILWAVDQLSGLQHIHTGLQARAASSEPVAAVLNAVQSDMRSRLQVALTDLVAPKRIKLVADTIFIFVQGVLATPMEPSRRRRTLRFLLGQLIRE